ncbi:hypothetical protein [Microbacterium sp. P03]|uniref:hypothetical protein n=1 Tax=Microbacterium sp. P03 TaxID=3366946 RepID=UPI0037469353
MSTHRRFGLVLAALAVIGAMAVPRFLPTVTEASWADPESAAGSFTALTVPPPTVTACTVIPGTLGILGSFNVTFQVPTGYAVAAVGYAVANNATMAGASAVTPAVSGPASGSYTASFGTGLLGLLGSDVYLGIRIVDAGTGWGSTYKVSHGRIGLLASSSSCAVL